jgi:hypothetical protein
MIVVTSSGTAPLPIKAPGFLASKPAMSITA